MEHKQLLSDASIRSPVPFMSLQTEKVMKKSNFLSIPDTIQEQTSGELSGDSLKMEASAVLTKSFNSDEKENNRKEQSICNESSDNSIIPSIDNSFFKNCEKKLLNSSNSDEEKSIELENKIVVNNRLLEISKKFHKNDMISTPPSALRKEISLLRSELAASDEFHDLEIRLLQEEKAPNDVDLKNYLEVIEKNAALMELYTSLKNEYDEYRKEQEKMRHELQSKTTDCLESLCSQIEASDSSLNFSSSFASFSEGIKSSTMMEDISEVEATILHDGTVLAKDPLSITTDAVFKTPLQSSIRSAKKLFPYEPNTTKTPFIKDVKAIIDKHEATSLLDSESNIQLLNLETALQDKIKEVNTLEQRLFKVEDFSSVLKNECERMKENLTKKTEQWNELTQKLFTETVSLNPALKDALTDAPGTKLLVVFIETIMEKCKNIQDELITKHNCEKTALELQRKLDLAEIESLREQIQSLNEQIYSRSEKITELEDLKITLEKQLSLAESTMLTREVELRIMQSNVTQAQESFTTSVEAVSKLESQLSAIETEKKEITMRCQEFEKTIKNLQEEIDTKNKLLSEQYAVASTVENIQKENESLKQAIRQSEEIITGMKSELQNSEALTLEIESLKSKETLRLTKLFYVLEEYKKNIADQKSPSGENTILELFSEKIDDPELLSAVKGILDVAKAENDSKTKLDLTEIENLRNQLKSFEEKLSENELKLSEILTEKNELQILYEDLKAQLHAAEAVISQRDEEIKSLRKLDENNKETESTLTNVLEENSELKKLCEDFKAQLIEAEKIIFTRDEEINELRKQNSQENNEIEFKLSKMTAEIEEFKKFSDDLRKQLNDAESVISMRDEEISNLKESEDQKNRENECKLSEILGENNEFKKMCENLRTQLSEAETVISLHNTEIVNFRKQKNILEQLKIDFSSLGEIESDDLLIDKIEKLVKEQSELQTDEEGEDSKIVSVFVNTLTKTCKEVQNEFIKRIKTKQSEFESQRNVDLNKIENLELEIRTLRERSDQQESRITEISVAKEDLQKLHDNLTVQMTEAQNVISTCNEEIRILRTHEETLKQTKEELAIADDAIITLKSQLESTESQNAEVKAHCRGLEQTISELRLCLESSAQLSSDLQATKLAMENFQNENEKLKQFIEESEKSRLESISQEELLQQIESLKHKESSRFTTLFTIIEDCKKKITETAPDSESKDIENTVFKMISEKLASSGDSQLLCAVESILDFVNLEWSTKINSHLTQIENLQNQIKSLSEKNEEYESKLTEIMKGNEEFNKSCEDLKNQLRETENRLALREQEIAILKKQEDVLNEMKDAIALADETISKLKTQLSVIEAEKKETENSCRELEQTVQNFKIALEEKDKIISELNVAASDFNNVQKENENLKELIQKSLLSNENLIHEIEVLKTKEMSRFNVFFNILEEIQKNKPNTTSRLDEKVILELFSNKIDDTQLLSAVEAILGFVRAEYECEREKYLTEIENLQKQIETFSAKFTESESKLSKFVSENDEFSKLCEKLKTQVEEAERTISIRDEEISDLKKSEDQKNRENECKLSEILGENNEFKTMCENLRTQLSEAETVISLHNTEIVNFRKQKNILEQLKIDFSSLGEVESDDLLIDKIEKLVKEQSELQTDEEEEDSKIVSVFVNTLTKTCKEVQNEFIKRIKTKQSEFESQRNVDLNKIENLELEIRTLRERSDQQESRITEISVAKEDLQKLHDNLTVQMTEAQNVISTCNEEIRILRTHEETLKQTKEELAIADDAIVTLKSQLALTESQKRETELLCRQLEESKVILQTEIDTKETIIKGLDELKYMRERMEDENGELKKEILRSEDIIHQLNKELESAAEDQKTKELQIKNLLNEVDFLKKEKETLTEFSSKLEKLEKRNKNLMDVFNDVQSHLDLPDDTVTKLLSGNLESKKVITERMNNLVKSQTEGLQAENKSLRLGNENLKEKVKHLSKMLCESSSVDMKDLNASQGSSMTLRSRSSKNIDLCVRRLDKLEDLNHNLTELLTRVLTMTSFPDLDKLKWCSVRDFPNITKKVVAHISDIDSKLKELKEENATLDEECETYSNIIKDLKKEAAAVWRSNKEKTETMEAEISKLKEEKEFWENERRELLSKISKLENECQKLKSANKTEGPPHSCKCGNESKKINELKRTILIKEQKLLELQDLEAQTNSHKSQIEYLKNALDKERKKVSEEKDKNKKLQNELNEAAKNQKPENKKIEQNEILDELRMRGSITGGIVQDFVDKEKMRKLSKDIGILKELCRARYAEIKRLEAVNASLRNNISKNSNQMDSPIRSRGYSTRSKNPIRDVWKSEISGKENTPA